ncbi:MAG: S1/P1 nuclease [Colwellia sp.]
MIRTLFLLSVFSMGLLSSQPSFALSKFGHQVICQLAFDHLSLVKQQRINQHLHAVPKKHQTLINKYNGDHENTPMTFASACTWADAIKKQPEFKRYTSWHYFNVPRDLAQITKPLCSSNCLPQAIITHQKQLQSSPISWKSAQELLFLGHWLGDIHQPLHVSYASDLGGNKIPLFETKSQCKNLHWYWDSCLINSSNRTKKQWLERVNQQWHTVVTPTYYSQHVWQWADESYQLVRQPSFKYCYLTNRRECLPIQSKLKLTSEYTRQYLPVMEQQILKAAQRLVRILEKSL